MLDAGYSMLSSIKHRVSRIQTNHRSLTTLITLITIECFLFTSLTPIPITKLTTHFSLPTTHSALRPRAGQGTAEIQSALDGGRKKTPQSLRRKTDEEVKVAYLFTRFDTLHGEIDRVSTILTRRKGQMTKEEETRMQLEFERLFKTLTDLSREFPQMDVPKEFAALQTKNKELARELRFLLQEIAKADEKKEDERLKQLNMERTQKLWLRSWVELELAHAFFTEQKNPIAALALLIGVRNRMADLQTEYWWRRVRAYIGQKIAQETLEGRFGFPVEVTKLGDYAIKISKEGEVTIQRRHWRKRTIPMASGEMVSVRVPEYTAFKFQDMPTALRSEIHIVVSQGEAYREILNALSNLQHILLRMRQQMEKREAMPKKELQAALEITNQWAHRGIATDLRRQALPDLENASVYLEKELYEDARKALERAKWKLRQALERQEETRERTHARALVFLNEWRRFVEDREKLVTGLKEAMAYLEAKKSAEAFQGLSTLREKVFPRKPGLLKLQEVYKRLNQTLLLLRRALELLAKTEKPPKQFYSLSGAAKKNLKRMLEDLGRGEGQESASDGGRRGYHHEAEFRAIHHRLTEELGRAPDLDTFVEAVGRNRQWVRERSKKLGLELSPLPYFGYYGLGLYRDELTDEVPPPQIGKLRRNSKGALGIYLSGIAFEGLSESLGKEGQNVVVHFKKVRKDSRNLIASFWPAGADVTKEPPHAMRYLVIKNKTVKVRRTYDRDRLHHIRMLQTKGIAYESLPKYVRERNTPGLLLSKVSLFEAYKEPIHWSMLQHPLEDIRKYLEKKRRTKMKKHEAWEALEVPEAVTKRISSPDELLRRVALFEKHGIPFSPIYLTRATDAQKQKVLESLPYLQFLHFLLRLYGIKDPAKRNTVIESNPWTFLKTGVRYRLLHLRRVIEPHLGKEMPSLENVKPFITIFVQPKRKRQQLLVKFMNERVKNLPVNKTLRREFLQFIALYDRHLQGGEIPTTLARLHNLSKRVTDPTLSEEIQSFITLLEDIQTGIEPIRGVRKNGEESARDGGKRHTAAEVQAIHRRLEEKLGTPPDSKMFAEALGMTQGSTLNRSRQLGLSLTPITTASPLSHYRDRLTDQIPPERVVPLQRASAGFLIVTSGGISLGGLPKSLGDPKTKESSGDKVRIRYEVAGGKTRDLIAHLTPALAPPNEPPHASRRHIMKDGTIEIETHRGPNRLHEIRRLYALGILYEKLPRFLGRASPSYVLKRVMVFREFGAPVRLDWLKYSVDEIRRRLVAEKEKAAKKEAMLRKLGIKESFKRQFGASNEFQIRANLFEMHGVPFSPIYARRALRGSRQKTLESVPYPQFVHFILRLYGIHDPQQRKAIIEQFEASLLRGSAESQLKHLREIIKEHFGKTIPPLHSIDLFVEIYNQGKEKRDRLLARWMEDRAGNLPVDERLKEGQMKLIGLYIFYLESQKIPPTLARLYQLSRKVQHAGLKSDVQAFIRLLKHIQKGEKPTIRGIDRGPTKTKEVGPWVVAKPTFPRLFRPDEMGEQEEKLAKKEKETPKSELGKALREYEMIEIEAIGEYLFQHKGEFLTYQKILEESDHFILINTLPLLKRALGVLSQRGFIHSYKEDGIVVIDPWKGPLERTGDALQYARDGGKRHHTREEYEATFARLKQESGREPDSGDMAKALGVATHHARTQSLAYGLPLSKSHTLSPKYKSFGLYRDGKITTIPDDVEATIRQASDGKLWLSFSGVTLGGLPESFGKPGDKARIHFKGEGKGRNLIAHLRPSGASQKEPAHATWHLTIKDGKVSTKRGAGESALYYGIGRYRDGFTNKTPVDHVTALVRHEKGKPLVITMARITLKSLPASLGEEGDKVIVHFEKVGKGRDLIATIRPYFSPDNEPPHARWHLSFRGRRVKVRKERGFDRLHYVRRLHTLGVDFEKLPYRLRKRGIQHALRLALLSKELDEPIGLGWFSFSEEEVRQKVKAKQEKERRMGETTPSKKKKARHPWIIDPLPLPRLFEGRERATLIGRLVDLYDISLGKAPKVLQEHEAAVLERLAQYLSTRKGVFLPYQQMLERVPLVLIDSVGALKRALGVLGQEGFIFSYKKDGVVVLDPWTLPKVEKESEEQEARDGASRAFSVDEWSPAKSRASEASRGKRQSMVSTGSPSILSEVEGSKDDGARVRPSTPQPLLLGIRPEPVLVSP